MKKYLLTLALASSLLVVGCDKQDAKVASRNLSTAADNFELNRRIVFYNGFTDKYILTIEGKCSFDVPSERKVDVTCKTGAGEFKKHTLGVSDNVTYFSEQIDSKGVSVYHYKVIFKPESIISDISLKTSVTSE